MKGQTVVIKMDDVWKNLEMANTKPLLSCETQDTTVCLLFIYALHRDILNSLHHSRGSCIVYRFTGRMSIQQWGLFAQLRV
jgi:hypothetical protein